MKIKYLEFENYETGMVIPHVDFNDGISLLAGRMDSGKSQILKAIGVLSAIILEDDFYEFPHCFGRIGVSCGNNMYDWTIETVIKDDEVVVANETLKYNGNVLFDCGMDSERVSGKSYVSVFNHSSDKVAEFCEVISRVSLVNKYPLAGDVAVDLVYDGVVEKYDFLRTKASEDYKKEFPIRLPLAEKIGILKETNGELFKHIQKVFKSIFPKVECIDIVKAPLESMYRMIKISLAECTVSVGDISDGVTRVLSYIVDMETVPAGSMIVIDSIEHGLDKECLELVWELVRKTSEKGVQFVITTDHPFVIEHTHPIDVIEVSRKNNKIRTRPASSRY